MICLRYCKCLFSLRFSFLSAFLEEFYDLKEFWYLKYIIYFSVSMIALSYIYSPPLAKPLPSSPPNTHQSRDFIYLALGNENRILNNHCLIKR